VTVPKTWTQPEPPPEPGMDVVRVRKASASTTFSDTTWWHIRPGQWYPASRIADRLALASLSPRECDSWSYVLRVAGSLVDDTDEGERPLTELAA